MSRLAWVLLCVFHSLSLAQSPRSLPSPKELPGFLLKGIAAGDYQAGSPLEYLPLSAAEVPLLPAPGIKARPHLFNDYQLQGVAFRQNREPLASWLAALESQVAPLLNGTPPNPAGLLQTRSENIKALAFLFRHSADPGYLDALISQLEAIPPAPALYNLEGGPGGSGWGDYLQSAEALIPLCVATDLVYGDLPPELALRLRRIFQEVAGQLYRGITLTPHNNHVLVMSTALITYALFEEVPEEFGHLSRQMIWQRGFTYLSHALGLIAPDGGYAEGVYYAHYIAGYLISLAVYLENSTGIRLFRHPRLERFVHWLISNQAGPGSNYPLFDDAFRNAPVFLGPVLSQSRQKDYWEAAMAANPPDQAAKNLVEGIIMYTGNGQAVVPQGLPETVFFPDIGETVFRDGVLNPGVFAAFLGERKPWFADRHEHIDPMAFSYSVRGEALIVDAGYGAGTGDPSRRWFTSPMASGGFLVDGMGPDRNPIYGDAPEAGFSNAFSTPNLAGVRLQHAIRGVSLERQVFFLDRHLLVMADRFEGGSDRRVAINLHVPAKIREAGPHRLTLQGEQARANMLTLTYPAPGPERVRDFSLSTINNGTRTISNLQLEQRAQRGAFLTLISPENPGRETLTRPLTITGEASGYQLIFPDSGVVVEAIQGSGGNFRTDRWAGDASAAVLSYGPAGNLQGLILIQATHFESPHIQIRADIPITLALRKSDTDGWQGYWQCPGNAGTVRVRFSGLGEENLLFNRQPLQPVARDKAGSLFELSGSGSLETGINRNPVYLPIPLLPTPEWGEWLAQGGASRPVHPNIAPRERALAVARVSGAMMQGFREAYRYWNDEWFNGSDWLTQTLYTVQGIGQNSYSKREASTYSPHLAHRYRLGMGSAERGWDIEEAGSWSTEGWELADLRLRANTRTAFLEAWQQNRYAEHHSRGVQVGGAGGSAAWRTSTSGEQTRHTMAVSARMGGWRISPSWERQSGGNPEEKAALQVTHLHGTVGVWRLEDGDGPRYYPYLTYHGEAFSVAAQGFWQPDSNRHALQSEGNWRFRPGWWMSPALQVTQREDKQDLDGAFFLANRGKLYFWRGGLRKLDGIWRQHGQFRVGSISRRLEGWFDLRKWRLGEDSRMRVAGKAGIGKIGAQLAAQYQGQQKERPREVLLSSQVGISHGIWELSPVATRRIRDARPDQGQVGLRIARWDVFPGYLQVLTRGAGQSDWQLFAVLPEGSPAADWEIWLNISNDGKRLTATEFRLSPQPGGGPGFLFEYRRGGNRRLEGYYQWRF